MIIIVIINIITIIIIIMIITAALERGSYRGPFARPRGSSYEFDR